jgi:hypothetical protein
MSNLKYDDLLVTQVLSTFVMNKSIPTRFFSQLSFYRKNEERI